MSRATLSWDEAQRHEATFWRRAARKNGLDYFHVRLDYQRLAAAIPRLAQTVGINRPAATVLCVGCGPCGLAPWMRARRRFGIDPLADYIRELGIDYGRLGYDAVVAGTAERLAVAVTRMGITPPDLDIVICHNVLDHVDDVDAACQSMAAIGHAGSEVFLSYDVRTVPTAMHPRTIDCARVDAALTAAGWACEHTETAPPHAGHVAEASGRVYAHYRRRDTL